MEIIMLTGKPGKGKTATLHLVQEILVATDKVKTIFAKHVGADNQRDFFAVLEYQKKTIKIFTMGDVEDEDAAEELEDEIKKALGENCDFFICACNDVRFYENLKKNEPHLFEKVEYHPIEKTLAKSHNARLAANWYDAYRIIEVSRIV